MIIPDLDAVNAIIRDASERIVMPGFRTLGDDAIFEKRPGEVVTDVDIAAEKYLSERLCALIPDSRLLGEECFEDDPSLMNLMDTDGPVWVVDPIDGTANFAEGRACFAVMVAYRNNGETLCGWIYDPVTDRMISARKGEGAQCNGTRITAAEQGAEIKHLTGSLGARLGKQLDRLREQNSRIIPQRVKRYRCCGREYMDLALGHLQFIQYGISLKPWDHAPVVLIAEEAGYHAAFLEDNTPYDARGGIRTGYLMAAPGKVAWDELRALLWV